MKKHRIAKIREASGTDEKEVSPEQLKQAQEWIADKLLEIVVKTPKDAPPVKESFSELLAAFHAPKRAPVIVQMHDGNRVVVANGVTKIISGADAPTPTKNITGGDTGAVAKVDTDINSGAFSTTGFDDEQLALLRKIQDAS